MFSHKAFTRKTALDRSHANQISLTHTLTTTYDLDFQSPVIITYAHAKVQGQWSVGVEYRVETTGQMDRRKERQTEEYCTTVVANAVCKYNVYASRLR